ncbi:MAG: RtcB family protein [Lachnospiraceae bacterium]|nr:RtcB family protein [Lachnospiraceae bacterium]
MLVISNEKTKVPIKMWLPDESDADALCMEQAYHLANLPFIHKWVSLMPDTHAGMGMPIGGVIAALGVIIPNAVGVDIGCGMAFVGTDIKVDEIREIMTANGPLIKVIISDILRNIPVGFNRHKDIQSCTALDIALESMEKYEANAELCNQIEAGFYQAGTLGGGNHFIELQEDNEGYLGIMIHSGSRNFGKQVCDYFHNTARLLNQKWKSEVPDEWRLAFLPVDSLEGRQYINWMNLALDFAAENRTKMMLAVRSIIEKQLRKHTNITFSYTDEINCHHNYAALEHHYGKNVWVHRKGATRAGAGELAVIPGAMGSYSYIVEGLGNEMSFCSSSHGAGRRYSRKGAMQNFSTEEVIIDLQKQGVYLGKHKKNDVAEESRFAYKDIDEVMENQKDLVKAVKKLKTVGVVKG